MGQTSIPCDSDVRDQLAEDKPDGVSWSEYLAALHTGELKTIVEPTDTGGVDYDDVKNACKDALREELPDGVFR